MESTAAIPNPNIFVSYSHTDAYFVLGGLIPHLREEFGKDNVWVDERLNDDLGKEWEKLIEERLDWCDIFVYCLSNDSIKSEYCTKEYNQARASNKPIPTVPIIVRPKTD